VKNVESTLTLALSHPMGEGEPSSPVGKVETAVPIKEPANFQMYLDRNDDDKPYLRHQIFI